MENIELNPDEEIIELSTIEQVSAILNHDMRIKVVTPKLTEIQKLRLKDMQHTPLWERMPKEEFEDMKHGAISMGRKIFKEHEDQFVEEVCKIMDIADPDNDISIQTLRESYYIKTPEYYALPAGLRQIARLVMSIIPPMTHPTDNLEGAR